MNSNFLNKTTLIRYANDEHQVLSFSMLNDIKLDIPSYTQWLNTYGLNFIEEVKEVVLNNDLDDFLIKLFSDTEHSNKMIELDELIFVSIRVLKPEFEPLEAEQMFFVIDANFVWSIQERSGDYFGHVREKLSNPKGLARNKNADYLFFLILEAIIDHYELRMQQLIEHINGNLNKINNNSTSILTEEIEKHKSTLFDFKRVAVSLRNLIVKLENVDLANFETKYFSELKEQTINLISDIDFELQTLESKLNLAFSIQGDNLNRVMKTLTSYSVIFIPLTFIAGIYGMNFANMPELQSQNGYFILLGVMAIIALISIVVFMKHKWF
ncbi:MAG: CorA family divalent cation transporter [Mangrovibacterium sp.]